MAYTGHCLCGSVRFRIDADLAPIQICHCTQCRHAQGGPFATNIPVPTAALVWLSGADVLTVYESSPGKQRLFCSRCGSPMLSRRLSLPGVVRIRAGLIDEPIESGLAWHAHMAARCHWWPVDDDLPQYPQGAPQT